MVISGNVMAFRDDGRQLGPVFEWAALVRLAFAVILVIALAASPADAKRKKKVRVRYSPPQAAMVVDVHSGRILYEENADKARFPASITKVMTLYMLFEQIKKGEFTPDSRLTVSEWAASRAPSKLGLKPGDTISVRDAMGALVTKSANDVASVIAENVAGSEDAFARMMTHKARMIGMTNTTFVNASGLPDLRQKTTARDLITLGRRVLADFPEDSKIFQMRYFDYGERTFQNHNRMLFSYAGMEGMKTGYTRASGFNLLASCRRADKRLMAVVLGGSSGRNRNARMRTLLDRSWRTAVAMKDVKPVIATQTLAATGVIDPDLMPERNPAFHGDPSEPLLQVSAATEAEPDPILQSPAEARAEAESEADEVGEAGAQKLALAAEDDADDDEVETAVAQGDIKPESETRVEIAAKTELRPEPVTVKPEPIFGPYHVQVGSFLDTQSTKLRLESVVEEAEDLLDGHEGLTVSGEVDGKVHYRARFGKFSRKDAASTCSKLKRMKVDCLVVKVE
jgi:D-alanyl-D-alanine carboxypeptidase